MSLHNRLKSVKEKSEEKTIALRMPKGKASLIEKLAEYYGTNTSTLIREMIDEGIRKLEFERIVLPESLGEKVTLGGVETNVTYLPAVVELLADEIALNGFGTEDFCGSNEKFEEFYIEHTRLSVEHGMTSGSIFIAPFSKKEYHFKNENQK